ncbi:hypothetical protein FOZ62_002645, partial [Perkinsus olseni]
ESLYGLEVDAEAAMNEFAAAVSLDNVQKATGVDLRSRGLDFCRAWPVADCPTGLGNGKLPWSLASKVGVDIAPIETELGGFLGGIGKASTAPPGMDEIVAMVRLMQLLHSSRWKGGAHAGRDDIMGLFISVEFCHLLFSLSYNLFHGRNKRSAGLVDSQSGSREKPGHFCALISYAEFDRIVIDTAPTGHTLRLLSLPTFIHTALTATMQIYDKVSAALKAFTPLQTVYNTVLGKGAEHAPEVVQERLKEARERVEQIQEGISNLNGVLQNAEESGFVVVSIPTQLAVDESLRLIEALPLAGMKIEQVVINQMPPVLVAGDADVKELVESYRGASSKLNELSKKGELPEL